MVSTPRVYPGEYIVVREFDRGYWAGVTRMAFGNFRIILAHYGDQLTTLNGW